MPSAGTVMENVNDEPVRVPVRFPVNATIPSEVFAVTAPVTALPDCDAVHDIVPAPVESETDPAYVPLRVTPEIGDGADGLGEGFAPPHPESTAPSATATRRRRMTNVDRTMQ
jgi:hypothetical protein